MLSDPEFSDPAPVCLFAFRRPDHTRRTLAALAASPLALATRLTVYVDGPRDASDVALIDEVVQVAQAQTGFAALDVIRREQNAGLATAIAD